jgi:hypothetical protein
MLLCLMKMIYGEHHAQQIDHNPQHVQDIVSVWSLHNTRRRRIISYRKCVNGFINQTMGLLAHNVGMLGHNEFGSLVRQLATCTGTNLCVLKQYFRLISKQLITKS